MLVTQTPGELIHDRNWEAPGRDSLWCIAYHTLATIQRSFSITF